MSRRRAARLTEELDRQCGAFPSVREPIWDGDSILFAVEDHGNVHVRRVPAAGGEVESVVDGELWVNSFDAVGGTVVHAASTPTMPSEIFAGDRPLTEVSKAFCEQAPCQPSERFVATSPDGAEVEAWLVRPHDFEAGKRYPLLLNIHGGPFTQYGNKHFDEFQAYASAGFVVVYSNPRGSSGYSEEWGRAIRGPVDGGHGWGSVDYDDLMAVMDAALQQFDFIDPERLGVMGGSYGGYMTSWIVSHTDRFKAACSERAVNNMFSEFGSSDFGWFHRAYTGVWPFEDVEPYLAQSPTTYADKITTPLLILHSENDLRCHIEQAEHLFTILRLLGREVEFVRFPAREPRALARRLAVPPRDPARDRPRVVRALPALGSPEPTREDDMAKWVALTARKLKPGSYDDWRQAWEPATPRRRHGLHLSQRHRSGRDRRLRHHRASAEQIQEMKPAEDAAEARAAAMAPHVESVGTDGFYEVIEEVTV